MTFVYAATLVVQGQGMVQVQAIGAQTGMGKIGKALHNVKPELTPLEAGNESVSESIVGHCVRPFLTMNIPEAPRSLILGE
ncbi:MAG: hypothetical protein NT070_15440 [Cyanobacteria bacterium]|nr:hypothetical protein [Cyanobacteriota bacterium]